VTVISETPIVYVDRNAESSTGVPALHLYVEISKNDFYDVVVKPGNGEILKTHRRTEEYDASEIIRTRVAYPPFIATETCAPPSYICASPNTCSLDVGPDPTNGLQGTCLKTCTIANEEQDCGSVYPGWRCWENDPTFPGYCYKDPLSGGGIDYIEVYNDGWVSPSHEAYRKYRDAKAKMDDVVRFHYEDLGRQSYDDKHGVYMLGLNSHCCDGIPDPPCGFHDGCMGASTAPYNPVVVFNNWHNLAQDLVGKRDSVYHMLSHEWGHRIIFYVTGDEEILGDIPNEDCLGENIPDMFGALLSRRMLGGSETRWDSGCNWISTVDTPWRDENAGLNQRCTVLPYSQRSRFDWLPCTGDSIVGDSCTFDSDCPPYFECKSVDGENKCIILVDWMSKYDNSYIWSRFLRVLDEGPGTFSIDNNGENCGASFNAVGMEKTIDIVYNATARLQTSTDLSDWIMLLSSAGTMNGKTDEVRQALGVVGFVSYESSPFTSGWGEPPVLVESDATPNVHYYQAWPNQPRRFYIWKDGSDIRVSYIADWGNWYTKRISANTSPSSSPAVQEYHQHLHIFWVDKDTNDIKFLYYDNTGRRSQIYNIGEAPFNMKSSGTVETAVFDDKLYVVYTDHPSREVFVAKCSTDPTAGCTDSRHDVDGSGWMSYSDSAYTKTLSYQAIGRSIGATAGPQLNGTTDSARSYLYIASAFGERGDMFIRIRIDQVDIDALSSEEYVKHTEWIPDHYPSYMTTDEIGVKMVKSAFPDGAGIYPNYLYLFWNAADQYKRGRMFKSVVQKFDDDPSDGSETWITWSDDTLIQTYRGVRLMKGQGSDVDKIWFVFTNTGGFMKNAILFGRY